MAGELALVPIRYDGLDAEAHQIDLMLLGQSLQGMARVLAVTGHFVATHQYAKQMPALEVRVLVKEPRANCFSIDAAIEFVKQYQMLSGSVMLLPPLIAWVFSRAARDRAQMKLLKDSLDKAIEQLAGQNSELVPKLLGTIERMADALVPAARQAVAPIGKSCKKITIGNQPDSPVIDEAMAEAIRENAEDGELTSVSEFELLITELDLETSSAKVRILGEDEEDKRFKALVIDPVLHTSGNVYLTAFVSRQPLVVQAKAGLRGGEIQTLYISDARLGEPLAIAKAMERGREG